MAATWAGLPVKGQAGGGYNSSDIHKLFYSIKIYKMLSVI